MRCAALLVALPLLAAGQAGAANETASSGDMCQSVHSLNCLGQDLQNIGPVNDHMACCQACERHSGCAAWSWHWQGSKDCHLKSGCSSRSSDYGYHSGVGSPSPAPPAPAPPPSGNLCQSQHSLNCMGQDLQNIGPVNDHMSCCQACERHSGCAAWSWHWQGSKNCYLKSGCSSRARDYGYHSGVGGHPSPPGPPAPPAPPTPAGSKKGVAHKGLSSRDAAAMRSAGATWYHNWGETADNSVLTFRATVWGRDQLRSLDRLPRGGVLLGFNEPNMDHGHGGSAMSVSEAARDWPQVEAAARRLGASLVAPQLAWVKPNEWYDQFFASCNGCKDRLQGVAAHTYNCDLPSLKHFVGLFRKYGKPLWITEMACAGKSAAQQCAYMREAFPYLDREPSVAGYAWFSEGSTSLASGGHLTEVGRCFSAHAAISANASASGPSELPAMTVV